MNSGDGGDGGDGNGFGSNVEILSKYFERVANCVVAGRCHADFAFDLLMENRVIPCDGHPNGRE